MSSGKWKQPALVIGSVAVSDEAAYLEPYAGFLLEEIRKVDWSDPKIEKEFQEWLKSREGVSA